MDNLFAQLEKESPSQMEAREARSVVAIDGGGTTADEGFVLQKRQRTDEVKGAMIL